MNSNHRRRFPRGGRISWACLSFLLVVIFQLVTSVAVAQVQVHIDSSPPVSGEGLQDGQLRAHLLNQAWKAVDALQNPGPGDELSLLSAQIKELKQQQQQQPTEETTQRIKQLEQERILLLRQGMLKKQFQMPPERIKTEL
jgi:hypothetical protein